MLSKSVPLNKSALSSLHRQHIGHQPKLEMGGAFVYVRTMIFKYDDRLGLMNDQLVAVSLLQHVSRHARVVLVNKTPIGFDKNALTQLHRRIPIKKMTLDNLLKQCSGRLIFSGNWHYLHIHDLAEALATMIGREPRMCEIPCQFKIVSPIGQQPACAQ